MGGPGGQFGWAAWVGDVWLAAAQEDEWQAYQPGRTLPVSFSRLVSSGTAPACLACTDGVGADGMHRQGMHRGVCACALRAPLTYRTVSTFRYATVRPQMANRASRP